MSWLLEKGYPERPAFSVLEGEIGYGQRFSIDQLESAETTVKGKLADDNSVTEHVYKLD